MAIIITARYQKWNERWNAERRRLEAIGDVPIDPPAIRVVPDDSDIICSDMTPEQCVKEYEQLWNDDPKYDPEDREIIKLGIELINGRFLSDTDWPELDAQEDTLNAANMADDLHFFLSAVLNSRVELGTRMVSGISPMVYRILDIMPYEILLCNDTDQDVDLDKLRKEWEEECPYIRMEYAVEEHIPEVITWIEEYVSDMPGDEPYEEDLTAHLLYDSDEEFDEYLDDAGRIVAHTKDWYPDYYADRAPMLALEFNEDSSVVLRKEIMEERGEISDFLGEFGFIEKEGIESGKFSDANDILVLLLDVEFWPTEVGDMEKTVCGFRRKGDELHIIDRIDALKLFAENIQWVLP